MSLLENPLYIVGTDNFLSDKQFHKRNITIAKKKYLSLNQYSDNIITKRITKKLK